MATIIISGSRPSHGLTGSTRRHDCMRRSWANRPDSHGSSCLCRSRPSLARLSSKEKEREKLEKEACSGRTAWRHPTQCPISESQLGAPTKLAGGSRRSHIALQRAEPIARGRTSNSEPPRALRSPHQDRGVEVHASSELQEMPPLDTLARHPGRRPTNSDDTFWRTS